MRRRRKLQTTRCLDCTPTVRQVQTRDRFLSIEPHHAVDPLHEGGSNKIWRPTVTRIPAHIHCPLTKKSSSYVPLILCTPFEETTTHNRRNGHTAPTSNKGLYTTIYSCAAQNESIWIYRTQIVLHTPFNTTIYFDDNATCMYVPSFVT